MTKHLRTLFVIADGSRARWVTRSDAAGDFATFKVVKAEAAYSEGRPDGAVFESSTGRSSGVSEQNEPIRRHNAEFAVQIAETLNGEGDSGAYERLAIIAPARMLGPMKDALSPATTAKLAKTLAKDLTKTPDDELDAWLKELEFG